MGRTITPLESRNKEGEIFWQRKVRTHSEFQRHNGDHLRRERWEVWMEKRKVRIFGRELSDATITTWERYISQPVHLNAEDGAIASLRFFWCRFRRYRGNGGLAVVAVLFVMSRAFVRCEFRQDRTSGSWSVVSGKFLGAFLGFFWLVLALETVIFVFYNPNFTRVSASFGCHCEQIGERCSQNSP